MKGIKIPRRFLNSEDLVELVYDIDYRAARAWRYSALRILWRSWIRGQQENGGVCHHGFGGDYWEGEDDASDMYNDLVERAVESLDQQRLWLAIAGFDINASIERWDEEPGCYGYVLSYRTFDEFERFVAKMFPTELYEPCEYEAYDPGFPDPLPDGSDDPEAVLDWAVRMMEESSVIDTFAAHQAGVPDSDLLPCRG